MPIILQPEEGVVPTPSPEPSCPTPVVRAEVPILDGCPALTRLKAYVVPLGITPVVEHVMRDRKGNPIDLTAMMTGEPMNTSTDPAGIFLMENEGILGQENAEFDPSFSGRLYLRCREIVSPAGPNNPVLQSEGWCVSAASGTIRFQLLPDMVCRAGIYQLSIAVADAVNNTLAVDNPVLWVERSLFSMTANEGGFIQGPPTIQELRQAMMDNGPAENMLLDAVEFTDDQLAFAASRPIQQWNSTPPPIRPPKDTRDFPFHEEWMSAICGHLFTMAAHNYRRNHLPYSAGGMSIDDKNKEREYAMAGKGLLDAWMDFVRSKKYEINIAGFMGSVNSIYGGLFH